MLLWGACVLWLAAGSCADPTARYDAFIERTADMRELDAGMNDGGERFDWSGRYLLALATSLSPAQPILFAVDASVTSDLAQVDLAIHALTTEADAEPRTPVGDDIGVTGVAYAVDGSFVADLGEVTIPGSANPISGSDIVATVQLQGRTLTNGEQADAFCGQVTGMVMSPVMFDLAGSTFGAVESPQLDATPLLRCP